jgi:NADH dehydrogenase [ubiquinone] 1 alpha subcomplex assembly factor 7
METLEDLLIRRIRQTGPLTLAEYMADCLLHPQLGYYTRRDPFGQQGDFTTSPEITQMFGELLGLCLAQSWVDQGAPERFTLVELGPGRGTLMADLLRATRRVPGFHAAASLVMVEASPTLTALQAKTLAPDLPRPDFARWTTSLSDLPDSPIFLIANEFFDALPIRQFRREAAGWSETMIGQEDGRLFFGRSTPAPLSALEHRLDDTETGDIIELRPSAAPIVRQIGTHLAQHGGAAILIDYGAARSFGDTFQALRNHAYCDPLDRPGTADLTAHVDFGALAQAAAPARATGLTDQAVLLARLGIGARAQKLSLGLTGAALESHLAATQRLTRPEEMGTLFKALALYGPQSPAPPGFDDHA